MASGDRRVTGTAALATVTGLVLLATAAWQLPCRGSPSSASAAEVTAVARKSIAGDLLAQDKTGLLHSARRLSGVNRTGRGRCAFAQEPETPHYWDPSCKVGMLGCWADGINTECRYCGEAPYTSIPCPRNATAGSVSLCAFTSWPVEKVFWDPGCREGVLGCLADGKHLGCRFCGGAGAYANITCPKSTIKACTFIVAPATPSYWDPACEPNGGLGCKADGIHLECRFCGARPFESVPCPAPHRPSADKCVFKNEPHTRYYWDAGCQLGILGCWADGIHAECRFCGGEGAYSTITCPH